MIKKKILKNLKPIDYDIHLKYRCRCSQEHWISYDEASEPEFIIVCDCKKILKVKTVLKFQIKYQNNKSQIKQNNIEEKDTNEVKDIYIEKIYTEDISNNILEEEKKESIVVNNTEEPEKNSTKDDSSTKDIAHSLVNTYSNLLVTFGYNKREAVSIVKNFYYSNPDIQQSQFVKQLLLSIGRS